MDDRLSNGAGFCGMSDVSGGHVANIESDVLGASWTGLRSLLDFPQRV